MKLRLTLILAFLFLPGCSGASLLGKFQEYQNKGETYAAKGLSEVVVYRCTGMTTEARHNLLNALNADLAAKGSMARAKAIDCDGDGTSDF